MNTIRFYLINQIDATSYLHYLLWIHSNDYSLVLLISFFSVNFFSWIAIPNVEIPIMFVWDDYFYTYSVTVLDVSVWFVKSYLTINCHSIKSSWFVQPSSETTQKQSNIYYEIVRVINGQFSWIIIILHILGYIIWWINLNE